MFLASKSPQRKALLEALGIGFEIMLPDYVEDDQPGEPPAVQVERHSRGKALSVINSLPAGAAQVAVLGVDTMVAVDGRALGKPADEEGALAYISLLSGRTHEVFSGLTLLVPASPAGGEGRRHSGSEYVELTGHAVTGVRFAKIPPLEIEQYISLGEWRGRAGAYAIQGRASAFVEEVNGDYTNVVGLPVPLLVSFMRKAGIWPPAGWALVRP